MDRERHISGVLESYSTLKSNATSASPPYLFGSRALRELASAALTEATFGLLVSRRRFLASGGKRDDYDERAVEVQDALELEALRVSLERGRARRSEPEQESDKLDEALRQTTDATKRAKIIRERDASAKASRLAAANLDALRTFPVTDLHLDARARTLVENLRRTLDRDGASQTNDIKLGISSGSDIGTDLGKYHSGTDPLRWYD